ncbi:hypothetical protein O3P69_007805, partial [Scylla paramamosain]
SSEDQRRWWREDIQCGVCVVGSCTIEGRQYSCVLSLIAWSIQGSGIPPFPGVDGLPSELDNT